VQRRTATRILRVYGGALGDQRLHLPEIAHPRGPTQLGRGVFPVGPPMAPGQEHHRRYRPTPSACSHILPPPTDTASSALPIEARKGMGVTYRGREMWAKPPLAGRVPSHDNCLASGDGYPKRDSSRLGTHARPTKRNRPARAGRR
jgi:hypothetical protein